MIRTQRTVHARVWLLLAPAIVAALLWTLSARPPASGTAAPRDSTPHGEPVR